MRVTEKARAAWSEAQAARIAEREAHQQELEARNVELAYGMGEAAIAWMRMLTESDAEARVTDTGPAWAIDRRGCEIMFDGLIISVRADDPRRPPGFTTWLQAPCTTCDRWQDVGAFTTLEGLGQLLAEEWPVTGCNNPDCPDCPDYYCTPAIDHDALAVLDGPPARELSPESVALIDAVEDFFASQLQRVQDAFADYRTEEPF